MLQLQGNKMQERKEATNVWVWKEDKDNDDKVSKDNNDSTKSNSNKQLGGNRKQQFF